jgi:hypothetical protein
LTHFTNCARVSRLAFSGRRSWKSGAGQLEQKVTQTHQSITWRLFVDAGGRPGERPARPSTRPLSAGLATDRTNTREEEIDGAPALRRRGRRCVASARCRRRFEFQADFAPFQISSSLFVSIDANETVTAVRGRTVNSRRAELDARRLNRARRPPPPTGLELWLVKRETRALTVCCARFPPVRLCWRFVFSRLSLSRRSLEWRRDQRQQVV